LFLFVAIDSILFLPLPRNIPVHAWATNAMFQQALETLYYSKLNSFRLRGLLNFDMRFLIGYTNNITVVIVGDGNESDYLKGLVYSVLCYLFLLLSLLDIGALDYEMFRP
jgi:hypothetical protein